MDTHPAEIQLVNGPDSVMVRPRKPGGGDPIMCRSWDLGSPEMRYTSVPNPGADGVTMSNGYIGSRTVVLELQILGGKGYDPYHYLRQLTRMTHPAATPTLIISRYPGDVWQMDLRGTPFSLTFERRAASIIDLQLSFTCPLGMLEGFVPSKYQTKDPVDDDFAPTDWIFPATFPKGFGLVGARYPSVTFLVGGDASVTPIIYIHGPVTDPEIRCDDDVFKFDGLTLESGETVAIDMGTGDIYLGKADSSQVIDDMSAYGAVDWAVSTYWTWAPGTHTVQYMSTKGTVTVLFRERRLTI